MPPPRPPVPHSVNTARARGRASRRICTASDPPPRGVARSLRWDGTRSRDALSALTRKRMATASSRAIAPVASGRDRADTAASAPGFRSRALEVLRREGGRDARDDPVVIARSDVGTGAVLAGTSASSVRGTDGASASSPRCTGSPRSSPCSRSSSRTSSSCSSSPARRETTRARTRRVPRTRAPPRSSRPRARGPRAGCRDPRRVHDRGVPQGVAGPPPARTPTSATTTTAWTSWSCSRAGRW